MRFEFVIFIVIAGCLFGFALGFFTKTLFEAPRKDCGIYERPEIDWNSDELEETSYEWWLRCGKKDGWKHRGTADMDTAGLLIADPSYLYDDSIYPKTYEELLPTLFNMLENDETQMKFPTGGYNGGHPGAGVYLNFGGDGSINVYTKEDGHGIVESVLLA